MVKRSLLSLLAAFIFAGAARTSAAAEFQPVLVFSFAGYQEAASDLDYLGSTIQNPGFSQAMGQTLALLTKVRELKGLDPARPWGAAISTDGLGAAPVAFFPVADAAALLDSLTALIGPATRTPEGDWKIGRGVLTGYVREKAGWAYLAQSTETLDRLPDPVKTLGNLPQDYDGALRIYLRRLPDALRTMAIDQLRLQARNDSAPFPGANDREQALQRRVAEQNLNAIEGLLTGGEQMTLGWSIDRPARKFRVDLVISPMPGSLLAANLNVLKPIRSVFSGIAGNSGALVMRGGGELNAAQVRQAAADLAIARGAMTSWIDRLPAIKSDSQREIFQQVAGALFDIAESSTAAGRIDAALALQGESTPYTLLAAAHSGNDQAANQITARLGKLAKADSPLYRVQLDAARLGMARVHAIEIAGLNEEPTYRSLFGHDATLYIVLVDQRVFVAMGSKALAAVEAVLKPQEASVAPVQLSLKLGSVVSSAASLTSDNQTRTILSLLGANLKGADHQLLVSLETTEQGLRLRMEAGEGVLRAAALGLSLAAIQLGAGR